MRMELKKTAGHGPSMADAIPVPYLAGSLLRSCYQQRRQRDRRTRRSIRQAVGMHTAATTALITPLTRKTVKPSWIAVLHRHRVSDLQPRHADPVDRELTEREHRHASTSRRSAPCSDAQPTSPAARTKPNR